MTTARQEGLLRHSILLMAVTQIGSVSNLLFHAVMGRALSAAEYGAMSSMFGIVLIAATPMEALRTAMAHFAARLDQQRRRAAVPGLVWKWSARMAWIALAIVLAGTLFSSPIADFFHLQDHDVPIAATEGGARPPAEPEIVDAARPEGSPYPAGEGRALVVLTSLVLAGSIFIPILVGALLGLQSFVWMSVCQHSWGVIRLLAGVVVVLFVGATAFWGVAAQAAGVLASGAFGIWGLLAAVRNREASGPKVEGVGRYFMNSLLILGGFAVLMNADIVLVKHYFSPEDAGLFARAGTIGRTLIFLPMPVALALFPKVTSAGAVEKGDWRNLLYALLYVVLIVAGAATACSLFAWIPLWIIYGDRHPDAAMVALVRGVVWAMSPLGLSYLLMNFEMAQRRFASAYLLILWALGYVVGVALFHETIWQVIGVLAAMGVLSAIFLILGLPWRKPADCVPMSSSAECPPA